MKPPYPALTLVSLNHHVYPSPLFRDETWDQDLGTHYPSRVPTSGVASCVSPVFSFENELTSMFTPFPPPKKFAMVAYCPCTRNYISRCKYRLTEAPITQLSNKDPQDSWAPNQLARAVIAPLWYSVCPCRDISERATTTHTTGKSFEK
jgi:hypothetical protein